eukprot:595027-Hanusia_phi.AAC.6
MGPARPGTAGGPVPSVRSVTGGGPRRGPGPGGAYRRYGSDPGDSPAATTLYGTVPYAARRGTVPGHESRIGPGHCRGAGGPSDRSIGTRKGPPPGPPVSAAPGRSRRSVP